LLTLVALQSPAHADPIVFDFTYTGKLVTFMVPTTDTFQILAFGAQGANGVFAGPGGFPAAGGLGAEIGGDFKLTAGEVLEIAVGGAGMPDSRGFNGAGGGGGSFVVGPGNIPLDIAGGGGGGGGSFGIDFGNAFDGGGGLTGPDGGSASPDGSNGGTGGNGGGSGPGPFSGGGGGFLSGGMSSVGGQGGAAFPILTGGSSNGGFGGGGGSLGPCGGGGGGYSGGGGAGPVGAIGCQGGGGGGSFDAGTNQILQAGFQTGNGEVVITEVAAAVPEPASIALLAVSLAGLAVMRRRRRPH
jgi:hypothetical protein